MGTKVFDVTTTKSALLSSNTSATLHVYLHCSAVGAFTSDGDVTLAFINIANLSSEVNINDTPAHSRLEWHLTATSLNSRTVMLNGATLVLSDDDELPSFSPVVVTNANRPIRVAPFSYGFAVLHEAKVPGCLN